MDTDVEPETGVVRIILPWPPRELSPNARPKRMHKVRLARDYRAKCRRLAEQAIEGWGVIVWPETGKVPVSITFFPPSARMDDDNMEAQFKNGRDGVADAVGLDDRRWVVAKVVAGVVPGGRVVVDLPLDCPQGLAERESGPETGMDTPPQWLARRAGL